jgi:surfeit locus 1 family protein
VLVRQGPPFAADGPAPAPVAVAFRNDHLGYAITWYGLAASLGVVYVLFGLRRGRE